MNKDVKRRFAPTTEGCKEAREYLMSIGAWSRRIERMDGYSLVFHANEIYNQPKPKK